MPNHEDRPLYRLHELPFRTQYAELKERCTAAGALLPGTPGRLVLRSGTGYGYWYRNYYSVPGQQSEDFICKDSDEASIDTARQDIAFADWVTRQVRDLRKLQFQVADKATARVLVELHNKGMLAGGLVLAGTLAYMARLNELGAVAMAARTQDIDLACRQTLKLAAPQSLAQTLEPTKLRFLPVPAMSRDAPSTSFKRAGAEGLRIDILTDGHPLGRALEVPELGWFAQAIPHLGYLLHEPQDAALLAGGHCIPVKIPAAERFVWHKLYASASRKAFPEKALKDLAQAAVLAAVLVEQDDARLGDALADAPASLRLAARTTRPALRKVLAAHPQTLDELEAAMA